MDLEVVVEGLPDAHLANGIKRTIRKVWKVAGRSGHWSVVMSPSETRGQWDLGVRGPIGRHFLSFSGRPDQLPALVTEQLGLLCSIIEHL